MKYDSAAAYAIDLWQRCDDVTPAIEYLESSIGGAESRLERGRFQLLLGKLYKRAVRFVEAEQASNAALEILEDPAFRTDAAVSAIDLCVEMHQVMRGFRLADEAAALLEQSRLRADLGTVTIWEPIYHHNLGKLLNVAADYHAAIPHLQQAAVGFANTNRPQESLAARLNEAVALVALDRLVDAKAAGRQVLRDCQPQFKYALMEANKLLFQVERRCGNVGAAIHYLDRTRTIGTEMIGQKDTRVLLELVLAEADLDESRGDIASAERFRLLVRQWAAAGRIHGLPDTETGGGGNGS